MFKNGTQIASYNKARFHLFESDSFSINSNDNESIELVLAFVLCFDIGTHNDGSTATFDFGNISKEIKEIDDRWIPKNLKV